MRFAVLLSVAFWASCSQDGGEGTTPDAPDTGMDVCDPYAARNPEPQLLIGPIGWEQPLLDRINGTTEHLDVMIYELTLDDFINPIIAAKNRGVTVRVVIDKDNPKNATTWNTLVNAGVDVKDAPPSFSYYHVKTLIFDRKEAFVMSANLMWAHFMITRNYGVLDSDPADVADLLKIIDADYAGTSPDLACTRLVVSPVNSRQRLLEMIGKAKTSLLVEAMEMKDTDVRRAIQGKKNAGLDVRALVPDPAWISASTDDAMWYASVGIPVKYFKQYDLHAKLIVADDIAMIGSENYTFTSLNSNREIGMLITEQTPMSAAKTQFEKDWAVGVAAP